MVIIQVLKVVSLRHLETTSLKKIQQNLGMLLMAAPFLKKLLELY